MVDIRKIIEMGPSGIWARAKEEAREWKKDFADSRQESVENSCKYYDHSSGVDIGGLKIGSVLKVLERYAHITPETDANIINGTHITPDRLNALLSTGDFSLRRNIDAILDMVLPPMHTKSLDDIDTSTLRGKVERKTRVSPYSPEYIQPGTEDAATLAQRREKIEELRDRLLLMQRAYYDFTPVTVALDTLMCLADNEERLAALHQHFRIRSDMPSSLEEFARKFKEVANIEEEITDLKAPSHAGYEGAVYKRAANGLTDEIQTATEKTQRNL